MDQMSDPGLSLAVAITKAASKQTYYTIRFFVDRERLADAYRAYGYFRWVDNVLDEDIGPALEKAEFANRQQSLLEACYRGETPDDLCLEERLLVELVQHDTEINSGLQVYLRNMMGVMAFDARRRGQLITHADLSDYTRMLATAITEAMYYFIGHGEPLPRYESRYLMVAAAHITHMLRDTYEDLSAGYFNIPRGYLTKHDISVQDLESRAYQEWVRYRVRLARRYFSKGRKCFAQVKNLRRRLAGYGYLARFEWILSAIERDNYRLRVEYPERKSLKAGLWMGWSTLVSILASSWKIAGSRTLSTQHVRIGEQ